MYHIREKLEKIKAAFKRTYQKYDCNTISHNSSDVSEILKQSIGKKPYRIATSGYSLPQEDYEDITLKFFKELNKRLKSGKTGYITTPDLCPGSIYDITTKVSHLKATDVLFFTTQQYWANTSLASFSKDVNMKKYIKAPIHIFPDNKTYTEATANASNILVCTGGKTVAITEIVEALKRKNKVILLINEKLKNEGLDSIRENVEYAAKYFLDYIVNCQKDLPTVKELDLDFLRTHPGRQNQLLRVYFVKDDESIQSAALRASNFIKNKTAYDFWPDKADEIDKALNPVQRRIDRQTALEHWQKAGQYKTLYD